MKCFIVLALVAAASALPAMVNTGASSQFRSQDNAGNYAFGYDESHATGGTFRKESGSPGVKVGSYGLRDIDGRVRTVNYVADAAGYRVNIQTNEPGVEPKDPADTLINKAVVAAPAVIAAPAPLIAAPAPLIAAPAYAPAQYAQYAAPQYAAPILAAPQYAAAPIVAHAPAYSGFSYTSAAIHAAPARYAAAPLIAAAPAYAAAPLVAAAPAYAQQYRMY